MLRVHTDLRRKFLTSDSVFPSVKREKKLKLPYMAYTHRHTHTLIHVRKYIGKLVLFFFLSHHDCLSLKCGEYT